MKKSEKLKLVFDFIADYLSDEPIEETVEETVEETESIEDDLQVSNGEEDKYKRAYKIMKKVEDIDKTHYKVRSEVKDKVKPIIDELKKVKTEYEDKLISERDKERTGVTLDDNGNLIKVSVPNTLEERDELKNKTANDYSEKDSPNNID